MVIETQKITYVKPPSRRANCGLWTWFQHHEEGGYTFGPLFCESWNCPACRQVKIDKLVARLAQVEVVQYHEIFFPHRRAEVLPALRRWLKAEKRRAGKFDYFLVIRAERHTTTVGLFLSSGSIPPRQVQEHFVREGFTAIVEGETLYRPEGRRDKLVSLLSRWDTQDQFIHRVSHSRGFFGADPSPLNQAQKGEIFVSRVPLGWWLSYFSERHLNVEKIGENVFQVFGFAPLEPRSFFGEPPAPD